MTPAGKTHYRINVTYALATLGTVVLAVIFSSIFDQAKLAAMCGFFAGIFASNLRRAN
jgi:hypothetical protein